MIQLRQDKSRAETANKLSLETEKERDTVEKTVEELKRQLQPKRSRTDDDADDVHEIITEVDSEVSHRHGRLLASHVSWSGWVDFILVFWGLCSGSRYTCGVNEHARSHGARQ